MSCYRQRPAAVGDQDITGHSVTAEDSVITGDLNTEGDSVTACDPFPFSDHVTKKWLVISPVVFVTACKPVTTSN
jgi:hypothetical protein